MGKRYQLQYGKYLIEEKRDFGNDKYWIDGFPVSHGYGGVLDHCNPMPGATGFKSVKEAKLACDILDAVRGNGDKFWERWRLIDRVSGSIASSLSVQGQA